MNEEKLIGFFKSRLEELPELHNYKDHHNQAFTAWIEIIKSTVNRMGGGYTDRLSRIRFTPGAVIGGGDNSKLFKDAYDRGLDNTEAVIKSIIQELELWGLGDSVKADSTATKPHSGPVTLNLSISQQQAQQISQTINLSQYDTEVQDKVRELLEELKKGTKNKEKIKESVKWLADKGIDALIAVLLAATQLS